MRLLNLAAAVFLAAAEAFAAPPLLCPAGAPIGSFKISVSRPEGGPAIALQAVNEIEPGYKVSYVPATVNSPDKKKARVALVVAPSDHGKILVLDPKPANADAEWTVPIRAQIVSVVYGPQGLDKGKIGDLVKKNDEVIGQLADYAQKTQETQALIQAITQQQQALDTGQSVNAAVVSFASQFPGAPKIDRTQPLNQQTLTLLQGVNPALSAYDPLAPSPTQRAAQSAGLAAVVAGLFFGTNVGLAATGGAVLVNMHSLFFPGTEFRSAFAQTSPERKGQTALCGNKTPSAARTELAFLWATRIPDAPAPEISIPKPVHLPIGVKSSFPLTVKAREWSLAARVQDWKLVSVADEKISIPVGAKVNTEAKTIELDVSDAKLKPGEWKLAGNWDWKPLAAGDLDLRAFSTFAKVRLTPASQDRMAEGTSKTVIELEGDDFEFLDKLAWKYCDDPFAQPNALPFHLPKGPREGPQQTLETQIEPKSMPIGNYRFLLTQADGKAHEAPFKVLPAPPQISNLPVLVNSGDEFETVTFRGTGLDRVEALLSDEAQVKLLTAAAADTLRAEIRLKPEVKQGTRLALQMKAKDFQQPVALADALLAAGPRPEIQGFRVSLPPDLGIALQPGELPGNSFVSFDLSLAHADSSDVTAVHLSCEGSTAITTLKVHPQPHAPLFLSLDPSSVGPAGCEVMATVSTAGDGESKPTKLGTIVRLPKIDSFEMTSDKAEGNAYYGELKGVGLEAIERVGWDSVTGTPVQAIPSPAPGNTNRQVLRVALPWPAPAPHAPLFIWLRGESAGRATTAKW